MKKKKYLTVRTVLKFNQKITERHKFDTHKRRKILKQNISIYKFQKFNRKITERFNIDTPKKKKILKQNISIYSSYLCL